MPEYIKVGQVINTHGWQGGLKVYPLTDDPARFFALKEVYLQLAADYVCYSLKKVSLQPNAVLLWLTEVKDLSTAKKLKGSYLVIPRAAVQPLPEDSYYLFELIGLAVYENEQYLGEICEVLQPGANDVFVVQTPQQKKIYIPALKKVVTRLDLAKRRMDVQLLPGLLDEE